MILRTSQLIFICSFVQLYQTNPTPQDKDKQQGPCIGMDCLHGILMHGDEAQGEDHKAEDQYLRFKSVLDTEKPLVGPLDAGQQHHGILMHGDSEAGKHHDEDSEILPQLQIQTGPQDLSEVIHKGMHAEGESLRHNLEKEAVKSNGEQSGPHGEELMHGVLMHGDANFVHTEESGVDTEIRDESGKKVGPQDAGEYLHGVLMHGDSEPGKEHTHEAPSQTEDAQGPVGPNNDLHGVLMHGDDVSGKDHSHEDNNAVHEVFRDISKIKDLGLDADLLKMIDLEKLLEQDKKEYADWITNNPKYQDETMMGSTIADVSDTILSDIQLMKKRYLAKNNNQNNENLKPVDDIPFTAEDARSVLTLNAHAHEGEDMRHDLELLGSTEPINARHRAKQTMLRNK